MKFKFYDFDDKFSYYDSLIPSVTYNFIRSVKNKTFKFDCEINQKPEELALLSEANITCSISSIVLITFALSFIILDSLLLITDYKNFPIL